MGQIPEIKELNGVKTLFVDGEPFLVLGGEIHNSSASDMQFMEERVWPGIQGLHLNTLLVPIYWELLEPQEEVYDFSLPDALIEQARQRQMHLVFLWFGLWKNSESNYVPAWVKQEDTTYNRVEMSTGEKMNIISPLCKKAVEKDARAFSKLMQHIKEIDGEKHTVLFMQVENEIGILGSDRDYSQDANTQFAEVVPEIVSQVYQVTGTWEECFGSDAGEIFMGYHYAVAVEKIAKAGYQQYPIPYYTNAWLEQYPWKKGSYPSGGPVAKLMKLWQAAAPSLFCQAPDIYVPYVPQVMEEYTVNNNPLFIPEVRKDSVTAAYCLYAFAKYNCIGYSPFGVEDYGLDPSEVLCPPLDVMQALNIDPSAFEMEGAKGCLSATYELMENLKPLYLQYRGTDQLHPFVKKGEHNYGELLHLEEINLLLAFLPKRTGQPVAGGMVIEVKKNCFYLIGVMGRIEFVPKTCDGTKIEILKCEEGRFDNGTWIPGRRLNGDERMNIQLGETPKVFYLEVYTTGA